MVEAENSEKSHDPGVDEDIVSRAEPSSRNGYVRGGNWIDLGITVLATVGLLTIVIGGSLLLGELIRDDDQPHRIIIVDPDEPDQYCYEQVVPVGGGLFDDVEPDDFDAEARFADGRRSRVIVVCEDW